MKNLFLIALLGALLLGCGTDEAKEKEQLIGKWELQAAERNTKPTESLKGLYFTFSEGNAIETNIMNGVREVGTYEVNDKAILQRNTSLDINYTVEAMSDSMLVLNTILRNTNFRFILVRGKEE